MQASMSTELIPFINTSAATATAKLIQSCPTLCEPIDGSPSGSPIPGIIQLRTLEWVAISFSRILFKYLLVAAAAKLLQSCPTLCDPIDGRPPGSPVPGILQVRTLEWVAIAFSIVWKWKVKMKSLSRIRPIATPWTAVYQAPPSMGFSRQEYWSGMPSPYPRLIVVYSNLFCVTVFPWKLHQMIKVLLPLSLTNMQY